MDQMSDLMKGLKPDQLKQMQELMKPDRMVDMTRGMCV